MALNSINTNIAAYFAQQNINSANNATSASIGRLSSGNRIVRAADDVAAMSVGTSLRTQVSTLRMGLLNANQGSSMLQVADGALSKIQDMLLRQKALATQATSGSLTATERGFLNQEFQNLTQEIDRVVENTNFNGVNLLGGGLGTTTSLAGTDALAATLDPAAVSNTGTSDAATLAIEGIDTTDGSVIGAAAGNIALVDASNTALADAAFLDVNSAAVGSVDKFSFSNVNYGAAGAGSATITVEMNGVEFTGNVTGAAGSATFYVSNGTTRLELTASADFNFADAGTTSATLNTLYSDFEDSALMRTGNVDGVSFQGSGLTGITGDAASGVAMIRSASGAIDVGNFEYASNASGATVITAQINGETWTAAGVPDAIDGTTSLAFEKGDGQVMMVDLTGMDQTLDIFDDLGDRSLFINALNTAFANAGGGVDFALGTQKSDSLRVQIDSSSTATLFGGQNLDVTSVTSAQVAGEALNTAINMVTSIRADVGALQSRFDFATANIEISLQNQDAARGTLLDTDIAAESSAYATAQVQLQAGIAVLAQANLLPQNLLKLIG